MTPDTPTSEQIARADDLTAIQYDQDLSLEQAKELDQLVCQHQAIRHRYIRARSLHADLRQQSAMLCPQKSRESALGVGHLNDLNETYILPAVVVDTYEDTDGLFDAERFAPASHKMRSPQKRWLNWRSVAGILLPVAIVGIILATYTRHQTWDSGTLEVAVDAQWADTDDAGMTPGSPFKDGIHVLNAGTIKLTVPDRAAIAIEGPARFELLPDHSLRLSSGKLCAKVIHGSAGLTVATPDLTAIDLGTEFAIDVTAGHATHLEVFDGQVRAEPFHNIGAQTANPPGSITLTAGQAVLATTGSTKLEKDIARPLAFVRPSQVQAGDVTPIARWARFSQTLRNDPDLVGYYPFDADSVSAGKLINQSRGTAGSHDGAFGAEGIAGSSPRWGKGRWAGKSAMVFGGQNSTAVTIPAGVDVISNREITLCIWLKRADLSTACHVLSGEDENQRAFNLGFIPASGGRGTGLADCINSTWSQLNVASSPGTYQPDRWTFISVTATPAGGTRFYKDGNLISAVAGLSQQPVLVQMLVLGAPTPKSQLSFPNEYFKGAIDELMIYKRALSAQEISQLYRMGNPY